MKTKIEITNFEGSEDIIEEIKQVTDEFQKLDICLLRDFCNDYHVKKIEQYKPPRINKGEYNKISIPLKKWIEPERIIIFGIYAPLMDMPILDKCSRVILIVKNCIVKRSEARKFGYSIPEDFEGNYVVRILNFYDENYLDLSLKDCIIHELLHTIGEEEEDKTKESLIKMNEILLQAVKEYMKNQI